MTTMTASTEIAKFHAKQFIGRDTIILYSGDLHYAVDTVDRSLNFGWVETADGERVYTNCDGFID